MSISYLAMGSLLNQTHTQPADNQAFFAQIMHVRASAPASNRAKPISPIMGHLLPPSLTPLPPRLPSSIWPTKASSLFIVGCQMVQCLNLRAAFFFSPPPLSFSSSPSSLFCLLPLVLLPLLILLLILLSFLVVLLLLLLLLLTLFPLLACMKHIFSISMTSFFKYKHLLHNLSIGKTI